MWSRLPSILPIIWLSYDYCFHNWLWSYYTHLSRRKGTDRKLKKSVDATECHQHNSIAGLLILFCLSYHSFGHLHHNVVWQSGNDRNTVSCILLMFCISRDSDLPFTDCYLIRPFSGNLRANFRNFVQGRYSRGRRLYFYLTSLYWCHLF